jgi:hypothetical protein
MPGYSILRLSKTKTIGDIKRLAAHHERTGSAVVNARQPYDSRVFAGSGDMVLDVTSRLPEKRRSDAVLALEFVLTTSPESQRQAGERAGTLDPKRVARFETAAREFLQAEFGGTATARLHHDETTPHVQGFVVPNEDWQSGAKLNAKKLFNPNTLAQLQTRWHEACVKAGLDVQRGDPGSEAEHEPIKEYYDRVNAPVPELPELAPEPPKPTRGDRAKAALGVETDHQRTAQARTASEQARQAVLEATHAHAVQVSREAEAQAKKSETRAVRAEAKLAALKRQSQELRSLPLVDVLARLGCQRHKSERERWHTPAGDLWVEKGGGARFNSFHDDRIKGHGAIDLVMAVNGGDFATATAYLAQQYGLDATTHDAAGLLASTAPAKVQRAVESVPEPSELPTPHPGRLERVKAYLTAARALPAVLVNALVEQGRLYADRWSNAVFLTDDCQGCEIRGTGTTPFHGHRGRKTGFTVSGDPNKLVLVEGAIEALSCTAMTGMTSVSTGGANAARAAEIGREWIKRGATVHAGQNADEAGEKQASRLIELVPSAHRLVPQLGCTDWNDALRITQQKPSGGQELKPPSINRC